ncbi:5-Methylcytosine G/T mismatch-specific DNA glycosylase [Hirsutella rhossiliensis]|uniref:5-Methylcytosine G/T mismatch-specific DNA glycosylase n=1 Tax=Hirsutella rhossiliensis TaxID=111463 RepID=A0A9P8SIG0_9HYPO|nr:5-Methylcytosine G/T mismatch-specific DNA glycosylase [Hirsutella rhossiliensis]KAH0964173.1 5-Methylcytosine G/T mismatch-specific DNA glycosylase [Hirsutella rhossiliensis]
MPSKDHDADVDAAAPDTPRDKHHHRSKSDRKSDKDREHRHHRSSRRHRKRDKDRDGDESKRPSVSTSDLTADLSKMSMDRQRISLPYPSFSKAHSKEAVLSRDDVSKRPSNPPTPEPTDCGRDEKRSKSAELPRKSSASKKSSRPPTPPETDVSAEKKRAEQQARGDDEPKSTTEGLSRSASRNDDRSKVSRKSGSSSQATYVKSPKHKSHEKLRPSSSTRSSSSRHSTKRPGSMRSSKRQDPVDDESSPSSVQDSSPKTPTPTTHSHPHLYGGDKNAPPGTQGAESSFPSKTATPAPAAPPPPPPPPPEVDVQDMPRVDYLLQNGGLPCPVPKRFLSALPPPNGTRPSNPALAGAETLFAPFFNILDQYSAVLSKHGSIAVATGHRSVARRLLDRLENIFSRDLPSGLTWGDVLEWVSGRIELPMWPPFDLAEIGTKAAEISAEEPPRPASPVKLDPDIAEEFRDHYLRQSKKVRSAVDKWLNQTGETPVPPPQDVDDETLAFAVLTNLEPGERPYFNALLSGSRDLKPSTRAPTPGSGYRPRNDFIIKCGLSLQRLYRLSQVPRDAECATYLVKNPETHDLLVTISNINGSEWEILTSGRFDGFLWSGADADDFNSGVDSRAMGSRQTTPFSPYSRGATPASFISLASSGVLGGRHPVSNDEEMEMAAAAEIEREIYAGMETLEDAFEKLHHKAEMVRTALRQRGAGLMQNFQNRRRIDVLPTPGSANSQNAAYERPAWAAGSDGDGGSDDDWTLDDVDIMPDDSASNISSSRHRRPKRRTERRTPAPIEEDEDEDR